MSRRPKQPRVDHLAAARSLRNTPGVWLPVAEYRNCITADRVTCAIRYGRPLGKAGYAHYTPAGAFEARTELTDDGVRVHARYIGGAR